MSEGRLILLILIGIVGLFITPFKLYHMMVVTGRIPGRTFVSATVVRRNHTQSIRGGEDSYSVTFEISSSGPEPIEKTDQVDFDTYDSLHQGMQVQLIKAGGSYYHPASVFVEPGNFAFDWCLLVAEIGCLAFAGTWVYKSAQPVRDTMYPKRKGPTLAGRR